MRAEPRPIHSSKATQLSIAKATPMERRTCSKCGRVIPAGRIAAMPDVEMCVSCIRVQPRTEADVDLDGADNDDLIQSVNQGKEWSERR